MDFPRWKVASIIALLVALMALAVPSFIPESVTATWPSWVPQRRVNLGLDLAGGSYLLLEADTNDLANSRIEAMRDQVQNAMRRATPRIDIGDISTADGHVSFMLRDPAQVDAARQALLPVLGSGAGLTGQREWDLQVLDTSRIQLTPTQAYLNQAIHDAMDSATDVVRRRIDALGTREPTIVRSGDTRIVVQVPGLQDPEGLKQLLGRTARLEFKLVDAQVDPTLLATGNAPIGDQLLPYPQAPQGLPYVSYPTQPGRPPMIAVRRSAIITGDQLVRASQGFDQQTNNPIVEFAFNGEGGRRFATVTQENVGHPFAIIVDNQVISAPNIISPILGGQGQITGGFTAESANQLAIQLRSGALPVALHVIEERTVGPDLGADSIHAGILASVIAVVAVIAFMLVTYGRFGVYANLAVVINVVVIVGVLALMRGTLTLPGIAGFVLTIGTAVDANVLINERIREERRNGRGVRQAVDLGYKEASRTIFEANVTHAIAGGIMLWLGSGPVRGFAAVLLIGIVTSVFTAVVFTRMLVTLWINRARPADINI